VTLSIVGVSKDKVRTYRKLKVLISELQTVQGDEQPGFQLGI
jgi:hypothetical protein